MDRGGRSKNGVPLVDAQSVAGKRFGEKENLRPGLYFGRVGVRLFWESWCVVAVVKEDSAVRCYGPT